MFGIELNIHSIDGAREMTAGQIRGFELHPQPDLWQQWKCLHFAKLVILRMCVWACEYVWVCVCEYVKERGGRGRERETETDTERESEGGRLGFWENIVIAREGQSQDFWAPELLLSMVLALKEGPWHIILPSDLYLSGSSDTSPLFPILSPMSRPLLSPSMDLPFLLIFFGGWQWARFTEG